MLKNFMLFILDKKYVHFVDKIEKEKINMSLKSYISKNHHIKYITKSFMLHMQSLDV